MAFVDISNCYFMQKKQDIWDIDFPSLGNLL